MLLGLRHGPILRHRNLSERYHTQTPNGRNVPIAGIEPAERAPLGLTLTPFPVGLTHSLKTPTSVAFHELLAKRP
jgi:hypothetical protein